MAKSACFDILLDSLFLVHKFHRKDFPGLDDLLFPLNNLPYSLHNIRYCKTTTAHQNHLLDLTLRRNPFAVDVE